MELVRQTRSAVSMIVLMTILLGIIYPLAVTGLTQLLFPSQANGSLIRDESGNVIGSSLIGQNFSDPKYFHPRPSAAGKDGYDAAASSGSNLGPTNQKLVDSVRERTEAYRQENNLPSDVPCARGRRYHLWKRARSPHNPSQRLSPGRPGGSRPRPARGAGTSDGGSVYPGAHVVDPR